MTTTEARTWREGLQRQLLHKQLRAAKAALVATAIGLVVAIVACYHVAASTPNAKEFVTDGGRALLISARTISTDPVKPWLVIEAHNGHEFEADGFHPSYTRLVADYKPMVKKLPTGQWEIQFTSEIAEDLP